MIRIIALLFVLGLVVSCRTTKDTTSGQQQPGVSQETSPANDPVTDVYFLGEVQVLDCGTVVQITSGESKTLFSPVNLEARFQVDKLRLKLKFKVLDQKATVCSEFQAIEIREAFAVR